MTHLELLRDLYRHMEWADATVWTAVLQSEKSADDAKLMERFRHFHLAQSAFLAIWRGESMDLNAADGLSSRELAAWARGNHQAIGSYVAGLADSALTGPVTLPWTRVAAEHLGREPDPTNLADTLVHQYAHCAHHRGQVATRLRELGIDPPLVDYILWVWMGRPEAAWP